MLPKFRPAMLGHEALARPSIRPVKPTPPPPPPSPPRRLPSGVGPRSNVAAFAKPTERFDREEMSDAVDREEHTLSRAPGSESVDIAPAPARARVLAISFDDETQARPVDDRLLDELRCADSSYPEPELQLVARGSARVRRTRDAAHRAPSEPPAREPSYNEHHRDPYERAQRGSNREHDEHEAWGDREASGPRECLPAQIPAAPRVPDDMRPGFVAGVQRIRTATPEAWGARSMPPAHDAYSHAPQPRSLRPTPYVPEQYVPEQYAPEQYAPEQHMESYAPPRAYAPPTEPPYAHASAPASRYMTPRPEPVYAHPSVVRANRAQLASELSPAAKVGRVAWFVAGAAFGIAFAFFATGFFSGGRASKDELLQPAPPAALPTPATAPIAAPVAAAAPPPAGYQAPAAVAPAAPVAPAPFAPAVAAPAAPLAPIAVAALPAAPATAPVAVAHVPASPVAALPAAPAAPVVRAAPPRAPRWQPARRPAASRAPRNLGGGGPGADDAPSAAPAAPAGADITDLLGAGLKP